ncbi:MAG: hypothetical protein Q8K75_00145 [Chlamydiales bacterium]|nr:hypothetical protein [Chlamydiales bacterium]
MKQLLLCILAAGFSCANICEAEASSQNTWNTFSYAAGNETFEVALPEEGVVLELPEVTVISSMSEKNMFFVLTVPMPADDEWDDESDEEPDFVELPGFVEQDDLDDNFEQICAVLEGVGVLVVDYHRAEDGVISIIAKGQGNNDFGWDGYLHIRLHITSKNVFLLTSVEETMEASEKALQFFDSFRIIQ